MPAAPAAAAQRARVVIIGGGLAGLLAAYELEKRGVTVCLLEASSGWGGRVATAEYGSGLTAELGLQELWEDNPLLNTARELGLPFDDNPIKPYSSVVLGGKLYPHARTTAAAYFATLMAPPDKTRFVAWLEQAYKLRELALRVGLSDPQVLNLQRISFADWVGAANLPQPAAELLRLHVESEQGTDWQSFSALFGLLEFGMFLGKGQLAYHVQGGNSRLIDALVRAIHGEKRLDALVTRVERSSSDQGRIGVRVSYLHGHRSQVVEGERAVVAVPFWRLHQIEMIPPLSEAKWQAVSTLSRGQYTVVHMLMPAEAQLLWSHAGPAPFAVLTDGPLGVIYGPSGESPVASPLRVFSLLVHGPFAAAFHMVPREVRLKEIYAHLDALWPGLSGYVRTSYVYTYHPGALPVWPPGRSPLDELAQNLREPELGLYLAGDYLYNAHSDGAARSGMHAAERIARELAATADRAGAPRLPPPGRRQTPGSGG